MDSSIGLLCFSKMSILVGMGILPTLDLSFLERGMDALDRMATALESLAESADQFVSRED